MNTTPNTTTGNRCGHNPAQLRTCDVVKRGRGGQSPLLGMISAYVGKAATLRSRLSKWNGMTSRKRRSEAREAMAAVIQFLIAKEFQLDSRRCAKPQQGFTKCIDAELMAKQISRSKHWANKPPLSVARVRAIIKQFERCGYITLSKQQKRQKATGEWQSSPRVIQFTKAFFIDLGGKKLWRKVQAEGEQRTDRLLLKLKLKLKDEAEALVSLSKHFKIGTIVSPRQLANGPPQATAA